MKFLSLAHSPGVHLPLCCWVTSSSTQSQQITEVFAIGSVHCPGRLFTQKVSFIPFLFTPGKSSGPSPVSENDFLLKAPERLLSLLSLRLFLVLCCPVTTWCHMWSEALSKCWVRASKWPSRIPQELNHLHQKMLKHLDIRFHPVLLVWFVCVCVCVCVSV